MPSFPELVVYLLPEKEWRYLVRSNTTTTTKPKDQNLGSRPPELNDYHYELLKLTDYDKQKLEDAYKNWRRLQEYENGKDFGEALLSDLAPFGTAWNVFREIESLFTVQDPAMRENLKNKWIRKGLAEAARTKSWQEFKIVEKNHLWTLAALLSPTLNLNPFVDSKFWRQRQLLGKRLRGSGSRRKNVA